MFSLILFELKSYLSNRMAMFWTVAYPIAMLAFLVVIFDPGIPVASFTESYRFQTTIGLVSLTIASTALFGMGQAMSDMRTHRALIPYLFVPLSLFSVVSAILISRIIVIFGFSVVFIVCSFAVLGIAVLGINVHPDPKVMLQVCVAILVTSLFCFALVLPLIAASKNATTIISLANVFNIYALMSSGVFIPLSAMPEWSTKFITTSPFYHLNAGLQSAFVPTTSAKFWMIHISLAAIGVAIVYFSSHRRVMVPA